MLNSKTNVELRIDNGKTAKGKSLGIEITKQASKVISKYMEVNNVEVNMKKKNPPQENPAKVTKEGRNCW